MNLFSLGLPVVAIKASECATVVGYRPDVLENDVEMMASEFFSALHNYAVPYGYEFSGAYKTLIIFRRAW